MSGRDTGEPGTPTADTYTDRVCSPIEAQARTRIPNALALGADSTDHGNALIFATLYLGFVLYVRGVCFYLFNVNTRLWVRDGSGDLVRRLAVLVAEVRKASLAGASDRKDWTFAAITASRRGIENLLALAPGVRGMMEERETFDQDVDAVLSANGYRIDLKNGSTRQAEPGDHFTRALGASWVPGETAPRWERFLMEILPDAEVRRFVQLWLGYVLTGRTSESVMILFVGKGNNGKSVLILVLRKLMGDLGESLTPEILLPTDGRPTPGYELAKLQGLRLAMFTETAENAKMNPAALKRTNSEDAVAARELYGAPFSFLPTHKAVMSTNHKPRIPSNDLGTWRRLLLINFPVEIQEADQDRNLPQVLMGELPGILNWAMTGAVSWYESGLPRPAVVVAETEGYRAQQDAFGGFIADHATGPGLTAAAGRLHDLYTAWAEGEGLKPMRPGVFKRAMLDRGFDQKKTSAGMVYLGISLDENSSPPEDRTMQADPALTQKSPMRAGEGLLGKVHAQPAQLPEAFQEVQKSAMGVW